MLPYSTVLIWSCSQTSVIPDCPQVLAPYLGLKCKIFPVLASKTPVYPQGPFPQVASPTALCALSVPHSFLPKCTFPVNSPPLLLSCLCLRDSGTTTASPAIKCLTRWPYPQTPLRMRLFAFCFHPCLPISRTVPGPLREVESQSVNLLPEPTLLPDPG